MIELAITLFLFLVFIFLASFAFHVVKSGQNDEDVLILKNIGAKIERFNVNPNKSKLILVFHNGFLINVKANPLTLTGQRYELISNFDAYFLHNFGPMDKMDQDVIRENLNVNFEFLKSDGKHRPSFAYKNGYIVMNISIPKINQKLMAMLLDVEEQMMRELTEILLKRKANQA
ncbi:MAG: hypothetical protein ABII22_01070 [Candidatus Micrarchaeota archaeon]